MTARLHDLRFVPATLSRLSPGMINGHHENNCGERCVVPTVIDSAAGRSRTVPCRPGNIGLVVKA